MSANNQVFLALTMSALLVACSDSDSSRRKKTNKVTPLAETCVGGNGAADDCQRVQVKTRGNQTIVAELQITDPDPAAAPMGTVLLSSGGLGDKFYAEGNGADQVVAALSQAGWKVVDRRWEQGWFTTDESVKNQSRRYAVLLDYVSKNLHEGGQLAAVGNASGASEIAYTMTTWDGASLLDTVVFNAGPAMSRLDYLCVLPTDPDWDAQCATIVPPGSTNCAPVCSRTSAPVCPYVNAAFTPEEIAEDSILHSEAALDFGATNVYFGVGKDDCTAAIPQALLFNSQLTSPTRVDFISGTGHAVYETPEGLNHIIGALMDGALSPIAAAPPVVAERITILEPSGGVTVIDRAGR